MIVHGDDLRPMLEALIGPYTPDSQTFGWHNGVSVVCLVAFAHWSRGDIEIMGAARPGGIHRRMIRELARYAFSDCACNHITARVLRDNLPSIRLLERLGFVREGLQRNARDGQDLILFGLIPEDFKHGKLPEAAQTG